jgi:hypothetical protein
MVVQTKSFRPFVCLNAKSRTANKQAELLRKMELAKKSKEDGGSMDIDEEEQTGALTDREMKEKNDRLRFAELLKKESSNVLNDFSSDGYLSKQQEEEEITAMRKSNRSVVSIQSSKPCYQNRIRR